MFSTIPQYNELSGDRTSASTGFIYERQPEKPQDKTFYLKKLTSYEVYTISSSLDNEDSKDRNKNGESRTDQMGRSDSTRLRWKNGKVQRLSYPSENIIKTIRELDADGLSLDDKKASLSPCEEEHIMNFLINKNLRERERQYFEWILVQFHREEPMNPQAARNETTSITIYLARAPKPGVDIATLYRNAERGYEERKRLLRQMQQARKQHEMTQQQEHMGDSQYVDQDKQDIFVVDKPTVPTAYGNEDLSGSMSLESAYDPNRQNQQNVAISSSWSVQEESDFAMHLPCHGTDWHRMATSMGTKTYAMVIPYLSLVITPYGSTINSTFC